MVRREKLPELLSPAGDMECLIAAVEAGADAVYVGGKLYSARAYAKNFDIGELRPAVAYCHLHGVRLYVTLNTLLYDSEIEGAVDFARELYRMGVDALIVADIGLIRALREVIPEMELHASTQMSVHNSLGADMAYSLGCTRVVLAREVSGENMKKITEGCIPETEVFLHGALCVCHSGQCLFSSMVGGRSGNRGECAQPCRLPYLGDKYPLSLNDLSLAGHIPELIDSGVASLKIEGRMKSPDYVYTVTSIYRKLLDERRSATGREEEMLYRAFSRSGFTDGYFKGDVFGEMTGVRTKEDKAASEKLGERAYTPSRTPVMAKVKILAGNPSEMTLIAKRAEDAKRLPAVTVYGDTPAAAINAPLTKEGVSARLAKMGNTFLSLDVKDIEIELDAGLNLSPASINSLRRAAADAFEYREKTVPVRSLTKPIYQKCTDVPKRTAVFFSPDAFFSSKEQSDYFDAAFIPLGSLDGADISEVFSSAGRANVSLPPVIMEDEVEDVIHLLSKTEGAKYVLLSNVGQIGLLNKSGSKLIPVADFRLNVMNSYTRMAYEEMGLSMPTLSPELTLREGEKVGGRVIAYGRIPLMITERCFMRENFGCEKCSKCELVDRRGARFPMMREYKHRNVIFNSVTTYIADKESDYKSLPAVHFIFSIETGKEVDEVIRKYKFAKPPSDGTPIRRIGKRKFT